MKAVICGAKKYSGGKFSGEPLFIDGGRVVSSAPANAQVFHFDNMYIFPGFADVHVHLREPGFSYKETIASGTAAAARGGYTALGAMPNLSPVPDSAEHLARELDIIRRDACVRVYPYGALTRGEDGAELSDMEAMAPNVIAFSDDGRGVQSENMMRAAMLRAKALGRIVAAHCEDKTLVRGGCVHDGEYAKAHDLPGIPSESEWRQAERDLRLARETGCAYHVCHVSAKESVELIRRAKADGADVTCETAPHYLILNDMQLRDEGRFKMNPPVRSEADRQALLAGIRDGTIDMIATDHAPHTPPEKARGLAEAPFGVIGLETALAASLTALGDDMGLAGVLRRLTVGPAQALRLPAGGLGVGDVADVVLIEPEAPWTVQPEHFRSQGRNTPFAGASLRGQIRGTICGGEIVYRNVET